MAERRRGRYRRPYVAVWVEDDRGPCRADALALGLVGWSGAVSMAARPEALVSGRSTSARRPRRKKSSSPSRGRPDRPASTRSSGTARTTTANNLPGGEYTVTVEAAREHGTYQSIRKQVALEGKPFTEELKGNVEIKSASIEYRRKPAAKE